MLPSRIIAVPLMLLALGCAVESNAADEQPPPDPPVSPPAVEKAPDTADAWLGHIEKRQAKIKTIHADITYVRIDGVGILDDKQTEEGQLQFRAATPKSPTTAARPPCFAIHFVKRIIDGRPQLQDVRNIFDGRWLVRRNNDEKIFNKDEIVPPNAPEDKKDPLSSGDGPFMFPVTAGKKRILKRFDATLIPVAESDPAQTVHLRLTPKPGRRQELTQIDVWYHVKTGVPIRVETLDDAPNQTIVKVSKVKLDKPIERAAFDVSVPTERGWHVEVRPYENPKR
jgi:hypothetical protein